MVAQDTVDPVRYGFQQVFEGRLGRPPDSLVDPAG
jgi:hypothetical protein